MITPAIPIGSSTSWQRRTHASACMIVLIVWHLEPPLNDRSNEGQAIAVPCVGAIRCVMCYRIAQRRCI